MKKVIIIDDDQDNLFLIAACVTILDVKVIAKSKVIPIGEIIKISPDLVLLDHWIDNRKGAELCWQIKSNPATSHIPVILLSAVMDLDVIAKKSCANGYTGKPFDIQDLQNVIREHLT